MNCRLPRAQSLKEQLPKEDANAPRSTSPIIMRTAPSTPQEYLLHSVSHDIVKLPQGLSDNNPIFRKVIYLAKLCGNVVLQRSL